MLGALLLAIGGIIACDSSHPRRFFTSGFWMLYAVIFLLGDILPAWISGCLVIVMAAIAGFGGVVGKRVERAGARNVITVNDRLARVERMGNRLFIPALTIPAVAVVGTLAAPYLSFEGHPVLDNTNPTLVSFGIGCVIALALSCWLTRDTVIQSVKQARGLVDALSWTVVLPQLLGMLGLVFADAGVGKAVAHISTAYIGLSNPLVAVTVYCVGMALFTMIMGNGFAAFPVMTAGVAVPVLIGTFHGNPAPIVALGMFSGYCGTLLTPMAANYNMVPAALLELPDKYAVIRAQAPTAIVLLVVNIFFMYAFMRL
jgi:uncharacterized membrane protein